MHDSRGAKIKVGDRVLIEAEVTQLGSGDENFCCCTVKVVTPDQPNKALVMEPPSFSAMSTKMLTKVGVAVLMLLLSAPLAFGQSLAERVEQGEKDTRALFAMMTATNAKIDNIQADVTAIRAELAAIRKVSGVSITPVSNWAGDPEFTASPRAASSWSNSAGYSQGMSAGGSARQGIFRRVFSRGRGGSNCSS